MQLAQVFLHTCRLELERTDGATLLIQLVCLWVVDGDSVKVHIDASCSLDVCAGLLKLRQGFQSKEVHLDQTSRLDNVSVVLRAVGLGALEVGVISRRHRYVVRYRVATDDESACVDTRSANRSLKHLGIFDGVSHLRIG